MQSILFIADGKAAAAVAESALMCERAVIARASSATEALMLLNEEPFDVIVCAIDELSDPARSCLSAIKDEATPTVIVTGTIEVPVQSFDINMRVVSADEGLLAVSTAVRQQLRRVTTRPKPEPRGGFEFEFRFKAEPCRIGRSRAIAGGFVQRVMDIDEQELTRLELALEEALSNAVLHGSLELNTELRTTDPDAYQLHLVDRLQDAAYRRRQVHVQLVFDGQALSITVTDEGPGFDAKSAIESLETDQRDYATGRGLMAMHAFADEIEFNEVGNSVTLTRTIPASAPAAPEPMEISQEEIVMISSLRVDQKPLAART